MNSAKSDVSQDELEPRLTFTFSKRVIFTCVQVYVFQISKAYYFQNTAACIVCN